MSTRPDAGRRDKKHLSTHQKIEAFRATVRTAGARTLTSQHTSFISPPFSLARLGQHVLSAAREHREHEGAGAQRPQHRLHGRRVPEEREGEKRHLSYQVARGKVRPHFCTSNARKKSKKEKQAQISSSGIRRWSADSNGKAPRVFAWSARSARKVQRQRMVGCCRQCGCAFTSRPPRPREAKQLLSSDET